MPEEPSEGMYGDVSIALITLNEADSIGVVIKEIFATLPGAEVVVVDGSSDATPEIAAEMGARVFREPPGGAAPALLASLRASDRPIVATIDADYTYPVEALPELIRRVRDGDDVAGTDRLGRWQRSAISFSNWIVSIAFGVLASMRVRRRLRDVHSAQRAYRRSLIDEFDWDTVGSAFPVDLLLWPAKAGCRISEIPIEYRARIGGVSKLPRWTGGTRTLSRIFRSAGRMERHSSGISSGPDRKP